jgi:hypothetical protein
VGRSPHYKKYDVFTTVFGGAGFLCLDKAIDGRELTSLASSYLFRVYLSGCPSLGCHVTYCMGMAGLLR